MCDIGGSGSWRRWLLLIALVLLVNAPEATSAVMLILLIGLVTGSDDRSVPVVGNTAAVLPEVDRGDQLLVVSAVITAVFLVRSGIMLAQSHRRSRLASTTGARLSKRPGCGSAPACGQVQASPLAVQKSRLLVARAWIYFPSAHWTTGEVHVLQVRSSESA